ncbi:predicted protein [Streptomyces filamentosus NRRL 15998]|uniref:Predicted protein n=1 Tax=Streptomyces filamentosus NRRL 15998 TaxID=457431 RepID=D6APF9_STRFL|nr:predicted protein [Streptomyces filamentosus NRRL 15998]
MVTIVAGGTDSNRSINAPAPPSAGAYQLPSVTVRRSRRRRIRRTVRWPAAKAAVIPANTRT